jgi:predicted RecB family nuclease
MKISSDLFQAFVECPTKCWLRAAGEPGSGNAYSEWVKSQTESYVAAQTTRLLSESPKDESPVSAAWENFKGGKWRLATGPVIRAELNSYTVESRLHAIERIPPEGRRKPSKFVPMRFVFTNKLGRNDRLMLAFDALVLSEAMAGEISVAKIIHGDDHSTLNVKTLTLVGEVRKRLDKIVTLLSNTTPPDLVLNRHCGECEFQARCKQKAIEKDDLSLIGGMSTKERQELHAKGIFTVTQLSYTFRPRRRPKRLRNKRERYHHSLKALAIRQKRSISSAGRN